MNNDKRRILTRDVEATLIPNGDVIVLPAGTAVDITHRLGGNFTVLSEVGLFRIGGENADVLGEEISKNPPAASKKAPTWEGGPPDKEAIWDALKKVFDPEIPVNIVDLGLVYSIDLLEDDKQYAVEIKMTLTAPGCGMGPVIAQDAETQVAQAPGVARAEVELVWEPPWTQDMISEEGKMELGLI